MKNIIATKLACRCTHDKTTFVVLRGEDGNFYAVREEPPYFCLQTDTKDKAVSFAREAIITYRDFQKRAPLASGE